MFAKSSFHVEIEDAPQDDLTFAKLRDRKVLLKLLYYLIIITLSIGVLFFFSWLRGVIH